MTEIRTEHPSTNEIEVSVFGPGFGESIVIHAGDGNWMVVDSCIDAHSGRPAALTYLEEIGVDPSAAVKLILTTHWHDDHIGGMSEVVKTCLSAKFACSMALTRREFIEVASIYTRRPLIHGTSGVTEIQGVFETLKKRRQVPVHATADRPLFRVRRHPAGEVAWEVTALSPTDGELQRFLTSIAALVPSDHSPTTKSRLPNPKQNDVSVAAWVTIGEINLLLGADLEEHGVPNRGWTAVLASTTRPPGTASLIKISHHGSVTGHHEDVWKQMLVSDPMAILTPWTLGASNLPRVADVQRIKQFTSNAYSTSRLTAPGMQALPQAVRRTLREARISIREIEPSTGYVRLRTSAGTPAAWTLTMSDDAVRL